MTTEIAEYKQTDAALAELRNKYGATVFDVTTGKGMAVAKEARAEVRGYRTSLEKMRIDIKAPALERCRQIDSEAKRITAELLALETPIDETIKAEENRKATEKAAAEQAEREAKEAEMRIFSEVRAIPLQAVNMPAADIESLIASTEAYDLTVVAEGLPRDALRHDVGMSVLALKAALDKRRLEDQREAKIAADLAELEQLRKAQAEQQAEAERLAAAERERQAAEARRLEDQARAEREATERAAREAREAEQARIDAERAEARRKEDAERAVAAEKLRKDQIKADADRARLEQDQAKAAKAAHDAEIANATLLSAAKDAVKFLKANGHGEHKVTLKLEAAIKREPSSMEKAA